MHTVSDHRFSALTLVTEFKKECTQSVIRYMHCYD